MIGVSKSEGVSISRGEHDWISVITRCASSNAANPSWPETRGGTNDRVRSYHRPHQLKAEGADDVEMRNTMNQLDAGFLHIASTHAKKLDGLIRVL